MLSCLIPCVCSEGNRERGVGCGVWSVSMRLRPWHKRAGAGAPCQGERARSGGLPALGAHWVGGELGASAQLFVNGSFFSSCGSPWGMFVVVKRGRWHPRDYPAQWRKPGMKQRLEAPSLAPQPEEPSLHLPIPAFLNKLLLPPQLLRANPRPTPSCPTLLGPMPCRASQERAGPPVHYTLQRAG